MAVSGSCGGSNNDALRVSSSIHNKSYKGFDIQIKPSRRISGLILQSLSFKHLDLYSYTIPMHIRSYGINDIRAVKQGVNQSAVYAPPLMKKSQSSKAASKLLASLSISSGSQVGVCPFQLTRKHGLSSPVGVTAIS